MASTPSSLISSHRPSVHAGAARGIFFVAACLGVAVAACGGDASSRGGDPSSNGGDASSNGGDSSSNDTDIGVSSAELDASTLDWSPGHYLLLHQNTNAERDAALADPVVRRTFLGLQKKYLWRDMEGPALGDYTKGFAQLDADLAAVSARHMKLLVQLQTKTFNGDGDAVPAYLKASGSPYCVGASPAVCGQYTMSNGLSAMLWLTPVRQRFNAFVAALGARYAPGGQRADLAAAFAAFALPETANSEGPISYAHVGYTQQGVVDGTKSVLLAIRHAFPSRIAFQYINFLPPNATAVTYLRQIADFALATPGVGLGCPDLSPRYRDQGIPGYAVLFDAAYARLPKNPSVQAPDLNTDRTNGVKETMDLGRLPLPAGMGAGYVTWYYGSGSAITLSDVEAEIARRGPVTDPRPTWP